MNIDYLFTWLAVLLLTGLTVFQIALVLGKPLGRFAWGGQHNVLPPKLRIGSAISIILYILFGIIILAQAKIISTFLDPAILSTATWVLAIYFTIGILPNAISRSKSERYTMTPIVLLLAVCCFVLVL